LPYEGTLNFSDDLLAILEGISDGVVSLDREAKYLSINKSGKEIIRQLGRTPHDLIGRSVWEVFPEVTGTVVEREIKRALANGVRIEYEFLYPPNQHLYQVQGYPSPEGVILVFRDLTSRENQ
jgi:PAS domain S-box-containing protein